MTLSSVITSNTARHFCNASSICSSQSKPGCGFSLSNHTGNGGWPEAKPSASRDATFAPSTDE
jgi:hypothetical protein